MATNKVNMVTKEDREMVQFAKCLQYNIRIWVHLQRSQRQVW